MILTERKSSEVAERLQKAVEGALAANNVSARRASLDVVGHDGLIRDIRAGRIPSVDRIEALFDYLGLEFYFGPRRERSAVPRLITGANIGPEDDAPTGYLTIPWAEFGSGRGSAPVAFTRAWLDRLGLVPDFLVAAVPDDIALTPKRPDDPLALLDKRHSLRKGHGLWCFRRSGRVQVSHITFEGMVTVVHSVAADQGPLIIEGPTDAAIAILGRVVWLGQSVPFKGKVD